LTPVAKIWKTGTAIKLPRLVLWLLVAAFLASEIFLFLPRSGKRRPQISFQSQKERAEDLQAQLD
jgi:hypothetical protein